MWYFIKSDGKYYFWEKQNYTVGRKNTDIIISGDDSISRNHALVEIDKNKIYLTDKGSKYNTFISGEKLKPNQKYELHIDDEIKFGMLGSAQSIFKVQKFQFAIVTSNLKSNDKKTLGLALDFFKASRTAVWSKNSTHLVVSEIILTAKVLCALTEGQPIVTAKYFQDYVESIKKNTAAPELLNYVPELNETLLSKNISLNYVPTRKTLFQSKIFVFLTEKSKIQMSELIAIAGGNSISWERDKFDANKLKKEHNYIFLEENRDEMNKNSEMFKSFTKCIKLIQENGKRSIPLQEIALAVIHNSIEENCNPNFNRAALLLLGQTEETPKTEIIYAYDTAVSDSMDTQPCIEILPSFEATISLDTQSQNTSKRSLDFEENGSEQVPKRRKEEESKYAKLSFIERRHVESSKSTNDSTKNVSDTAVPNPVPQSTTIEKSETVDNVNPFLRKRKAKTDVAPPAKKHSIELAVNIIQKEKNKNDSIVRKSPFENISNVINERNESTLKTNSSNSNTTSSVTTNLNSILKNVTWMSKTDIKQEVIKNEEVEDDELVKFNEMFKNCIQIKLFPVIKLEPIEKKREVINNSVIKNFKNFVKNPHIKFQTTIITADQMKSAIMRPGSAAMEEEEEESDLVDEEMDMAPIPKSKKAKLFKLFL